MTGPFTDLLPQKSTATDSGPFGDLFSGSSGPTQGAINQEQTQNINDNITQLTALRGRSKNPDDQARIDRTIASLKTQLKGVGYADPNDTSATGYGSDAFSRGVRSGTPRGILSVGNMAASTGVLFGSDKGTEYRNALNEKAAQIQEAVQPPGALAAAGEFVGEMPAQMAAFGPIGEGVGAVVSKVAPSLADIFARKIAGSLAKRIGYGAARAALEVSPITAIGAAGDRQGAIQEAQKALDSGQISQDTFDQIKSEATLGGIKEFLASTAGAAAFGAVFHPGKVKGKVSATEPAPSQLELVKREAEIQALNAKSAADAAKRVEVKQTKKLAKAQWTLDNPTGSWTELETADQAKYIADFRSKQASAGVPAPAPTVGVQGATAVPDASPQVPAALVEAQQGLDRATASGSAAEIQAATATVQAVSSVPPPGPAPVVPTTSPILDKGSAGLSPAVRNHIQRMGLKNAFKEADLQFDEGLTNVQAQEKLSAHLADVTNTAVATANAANEAAKASGSLSSILAGPDPLKTLGIKEDIKSLYAQGKTQSEIVAALDDKLPKELNQNQRLDLVASGNPARPTLDDLLLPEETKYTLDDIKTTAVRDPASGRVFEGAIHADAIEAANKAGIKGDKASLEQGYSTEDGHFIPTEEANAIAAREDASLEHGPGEKGQPGKGIEVTPSKDIRDNIPYSNLDERLRSPGEWWSSLTPEEQAAAGGTPPRPLDASQGTKPSGGTETLPPATPAVAVQGPETFLKGVKHDVPLEEMTTGQLDKFKDLVADGIAEAKDAPHQKELMGDLDALQKETLRREKGGEAGRPAEESLPRPYQNLSPEALLTNRDALEAKLEDLKGRPDAKAELSDARARLADIRTEIGAKKIEAREAGKKARAEGAVRYIEPVEDKATISPADLRKAPSKLGDAAIDAQIDDIHSRLELLDAREAGPWQERLSKLYEEKAKRSVDPEGPEGMPPIKGGGGLTLQSHPAVGAFAGGFTYGLIAPQLAPQLFHDDPNMTDEEYLSRAFMWGLGSASLVIGAKYLGARLKASETPKPSTWFENLGIKKVVYSVDELKGRKIPTTTMLREWYRGLIRSTDAIEAIPGVRGLPAERNPGKLAAYYGRYAAQAEHWLTTGPVRVDENGMVQRMEGLSYQGILALAKGDKEGLDNLLVALSSSELRGKLGDNRVPMNAVDAERVIRSAPQNLMDAAKAMRQYHMNLLQTQLDAGLISQEGLDKMLAENYYTPMQRVMEQVDAIHKDKPLFKGQMTAIEERKGGSLLKVKSPSDVTVEMTARMLRAAEYGKFQSALVDHVASLPQVIRNEIIIPVSKALTKTGTDLEAIADNLRKTLNISQADAKGMVSYLDHDSVHELPTIRDNKGFEWGIINHYQDGQITTLKVRPDVFKSMKSMTQPEKDWFWSFIGYPTRLATKGVVLDPSFAVRRGFIETYLGFLGSEYGFRPGLDQIAGWWDVFSRSQRYRDMQAVGGTGNVGSLQFKDVAKFGGSTALHDAFSLTKEMKPIQAMRVLMEPFLAAARAGENLAALRHGASTIEAAYAANNVLGNVRMQGYFEGMRRFNTLAMFARPTIAHVDKLLEKSGLHPFRQPEYNKTAFGAWSKDVGMPARVSSGLTFATKGFASLTLPSLALWYLNKDDDDINELRQTSMGSHYWFFRNPFVDKGADTSIIRLPKPQVLGELFGTSVEAHMDKMYKEDPDGVSRMLSGIYDEAALNTLPQIGVIPMSLWANKDYRFGTPIIPGGDTNADPNLQGFNNASLPSRVISDKLSSISNESNNETLKRALSPAGVDYVFNTFVGMLGQDALKAVNDALLYRKDGFLPAKEELPIVSRWLARYPSMGVSDIQKFYERDSKVQAAANTVHKIVTERPDLLGDYYAQNMDRLHLVKIHKEVRQKIADMRRALEDVNNAPPGTYDQAGKTALQKQFMSIIIQEAKTANEIARNMSNK